jgi:uncharacterized membrane protein YphA (DoxX/SURF4 family)
MLSPHRFRAYPDAVAAESIARGRSLDARWVSLILRVAVGLVFAFSGLAKVVDTDTTTRSVRAYKLLPEAIVPTVGSALPVLELALAVLLLLGLLTRVAAGITSLLSLAFFIGITSAWARGLTIECGCFGNSGQAPHPVPGYIRELALNALIITACAWLLRRPASRWSLDTALGLQAGEPGTSKYGDDGDDDWAGDQDSDTSPSSIGVEP